MGFIPDNANDTNKTTISSSSSGSSSLRTLNDCKVVSPASGQGLIYNGNQWQNQNVASSLSTLSDVSIQQQSLANGEVLTVNNGVWSNVAQTPTTYPFSQFRRLVKKAMPRDIVV